MRLLSLPDNRVVMSAEAKVKIKKFVDVLMDRFLKNINKSLVVKQSICRRPGRDRREERSGRWREVTGCGVGWWLITQKHFLSQKCDIP